MIDPDTIFAIAAIVSYLFVLTAAWALHSRLRNKQSRFFFWSVVALAAWPSISSLVSYYLIGNFGTITKVRAIDWLLLANQTLFPAILLLSASMGLWFTVLTIEKRA